MDTKEIQEKLVVFLDAIGRVIVGEEVKERSTDVELVVKNPVIVHVEPKNGNISIQFFPVFFKEFLGSKSDGSIFTYNKSNLAIADRTVLDFKLYAQYTQMFSNNPVQAQPNTPADSKTPAKQPEVIKLFED